VTEPDGSEKGEVVMLKKTMVGAGLAAVIMISSGAALAQPWDEPMDPTTAVVTEQHRYRNHQNHQDGTGECENGGERQHAENGTHQGDQDRDHQQLRDSAERRFDGAGNGQGMMKGR
jgi:hypothetical protein